jgi:REP element-mobilizing transposase RayT
MPNPLKYIEHGALYFVTSRAEVGFPFADMQRFNPLFLAILARAQTLYPVEIVAFILNANHLHLLLIPIDPINFPLFVGYVKQELSHAVNRIKGIRKKTIWCDGYDSPLLLDATNAKHYMSYIYTQAQTAHVVNTIEQYRGPSSWGMFMSGKLEVTVPRLLRTEYRRGKPRPKNPEEPIEMNTLTLAPYAWIKRLCPGESPDEVRGSVIRLVRAIEEESRLKRLKEKIPLRPNLSSLAEEKYQPKKFGKRMICICADIAKRCEFLEWYQGMVALCRNTYQKWREGWLSVPWPDGFFPPRQPTLRSAMPVT